MRSDPPTVPARGRGRRPTSEVRAGVLEATARLLHEGGIDAVTFDRVADRAGCSRTTLYKWWPSPGALAAEAFFVQSEPALAFPDTGDVRHDLTVQLTAFVDLLAEEGTGRSVADLIGAAQSDPELMEAWSTRYTRPRRALAVSALERARERGQVRDDVDVVSVVDQLWGAVYYRLLVPDETIDAALAETLVANVLGGIQPAAPRQERSAERSSPSR